MKLPPEVGLLTPVLALATVGAWLALELAYIWTGQPSVSQQIITLFTQWPTFGLLFGLIVGLLLGHWFW